MLCKPDWIWLADPLLRMLSIFWFHRATITLLISLAVWGKATLFMRWSSSTCRPLVVRIYISVTMNKRMMACKRKLMVHRVAMLLEVIHLSSLVRVMVSVHTWMMRVVLWEIVFRRSIFWSACMRHTKVWTTHTLRMMTVRHVTQVVSMTRMWMIIVLSIHGRMSMMRLHHHRLTWWSVKVRCHGKSTSEMWLPMGLMRMSVIWMFYRSTRLCGHHLLLPGHKVLWWMLPMLLLWLSSSS